MSAEKYVRNDYLDRPGWFAPNPPTAEPGDEHKHPVMGWQECSPDTFKEPFNCVEMKWHRRRPLKDFPGKMPDGTPTEVVGWKETAGAGCEMTHDLVTWLPMQDFGDRNQTPEVWNAMADCGPGNHKPILAIRRPVKVEKEEWKYCLAPSSGLLFRYSDKRTIGQLFVEGEWISLSVGATCQFMIDYYGWTPLTPAPAEAIIKQSQASAEKPKKGGDAECAATKKESLTSKAPEPDSPAGTGATLLAEQIYDFVRAMIGNESRGMTISKLNKMMPQPPQPIRVSEQFPKIVCLCGSTRFGQAFQDANLKETLAGHIVLSIGCNMKSDQEIFGILSPEKLAEIKQALDELHKRKIDLCDEVLVLNVGGYIGESTRSEIEYANAHGKPIRYLDAIQPTPKPETGEDEVEEWAKQYKLDPAKGYDFSHAVRNYNQWHAAIASRKDGR